MNRLKKNPRKSALSTCSFPRAALGGSWVGGKALPAVSEHYLTSVTQERGLGGAPGAPAVCLTGCRQIAKHRFGSGSVVGKCPCLRFSCLEHQNPLYLFCIAILICFAKFLYRMRSCKANTGLPQILGVKCSKCSGVTGTRGAKGDLPAPPPLAARSRQRCRLPWDLGDADNRPARDTKR